MSKVQVDTIVDKDDISAPTLSKGAIVTGVCTATTFVGAVTGDVTGNADTATNAQGLTGTPNITVGNVTSANVTNSKQTTSEHVNVTGISTLGGDVSIADKIIHTGDTNTAIRFADADTITAETGGSERVRVDSSGRIGIGTAPYGSTGALHVYDPTNDRALILDSGNTNGSHIRLWRQGAVQHYIGCSAGFGQGDYEDLGIRAKDNIIFHPGDSSTERLRIGASGEIGLSGANYGTSGQVLTSGGSGAAASWADAAGGAWEKLASGLFDSGNALEEVTTTHLTSSHQLYRLNYNCETSPSSGESALVIEIQIGGTWRQDTNYYYGWNSGGSGTANESSKPNFLLGRMGRRFQGEVTFMTPYDTTRVKQFASICSHTNSDSSYSEGLPTRTVGAYWGSGSTGAVTGIRFRSVNVHHTSDGYDFSAGYFVLEGCAIS